MHNPIIPGFAPDPAICRRGNEFFIAVSSFQWWPGVPIYRSLDLIHWELADYALKEERLLNLRRCGDSAGVWAPSLTHADGLFWLVYSPASGSRLTCYESPNYLITAPDISGPWSDPVFLNASGNDASLFHDDDGRKYVLNTHLIRAQTHDYRMEGHFGTLIQEYDWRKQKMIGPACNIFQGTDAGIPEGSKMYKRNGQYYLNIAEGGTLFGHCVTFARAPWVCGPFTVHPDNPVLTARHDRRNPIQRAGHADLVNLDDDRFAMVYLASRPVDDRSLLGRETFLASGRWDADGWPRMDFRTPQTELPDFGFEPRPFPEPPATDNFDGDRLGLEWNSLRGPIDAQWNLDENPGCLTLRPNHSMLDSVESPSALFRRIRHHRFTAETRLRFKPEKLQQWAGLACYYDTRRWYFLYRGFTDIDGAVVGICTKGEGTTLKDVGYIPIDDHDEIEFRVECDSRLLRFSFRTGDASRWQSVGDPQDALILTDEHVEMHDPIPTFGFTGAFVGLAAWDLSGIAPHPAFEHFSYTMIESP